MDPIAMERDQDGNEIFPVLVKDADMKQGPQSSGPGAAQGSQIRVLAQRHFHGPRSHKETTTRTSGILSINDRLASEVVVSFSKHPYRI